METDEPAILNDHTAAEERAKIEAYFERLWPLLRSITGEGVRQTHDILSELVPLTRIEVPSGTKVFDWTVPKEWVVRDAYVITPDGRRILDVHENNLHLVNYSMPFRGRVSKGELEEHLYSNPKVPEAVPYITSYYKPRWGFCIAHRDREHLPKGEYEVVVDTDLVDGSMTLSEAVLEGESAAEVLISTHTCHPSMANDQISGPLVASLLYGRLAALPRRRLTYRFVFLPETIGSIAYLSLRGEHLRKHMIAGYVVASLGGPGPFNYRRSRRGNSLADRAAEYVLARQRKKAEIHDFQPAGGNDQRQYCSPGFNLPVGCISHTPQTKTREYHSSLDNRKYVSFDAMIESLDICVEVCRLLETNRAYRNLKPFGEPHLQKYNLYPSLGGSPSQATMADFTKALLWVLNYSDGDHDLLAIAELSDQDLNLLAEAADACRQHRLVTEFDAPPAGPGSQP